MSEVSSAMPVGAAILGMVMGVAAVVLGIYIGFRAGTRFGELSAFKEYQKRRHYSRRRSSSSSELPTAL